MAFQLVGIDPQPFEPLFLLDDAALARRGARRVIADAAETYPCRVTLDEAGAGEELLLLQYEHQPGNSPYRASGPIFVRRAQARRALPVDTVTPYVTKRLISVRAYDAAHMIVDAAVCEGIAVADEIRRLLARADVDYLHLHNAKRGCYSCRVNRA
jgi:hypothetical protein